MVNFISFMISKVSTITQQQQKVTCGRLSALVVPDPNLSLVPTHNDSGLIGLALANETVAN